MFLIYRCFIIIIEIFLKIGALFNAKLRFFIKGRSQSFSILKEKISSNDKVIWFHVASMGEYEQGLPLIEAVQKKFSSYKIVLTFFSPSGYEPIKDKIKEYVVCYLPWDTPKKVKKFLILAHPSIAIFVKYEFWPHYIRQLKKLKIPIVLVSAIFREKQVFFKSYGGFMRKILYAFDHFFVQDQNSKTLLKSLQITKVSISGDTRFDRVISIRNRNNTLDFIDHFKNNQLCVVAGSTWAEDEKWLIPCINRSPSKIKFIIVPHNIQPKSIEKISHQLLKKTLRYTQIGTYDLSSYKTLLVDTVGLLTKIYAYADIAYIGGGIGNTGLHNTLEPAVFGIPLLIGPKFSGFKEAEDLVKLGGITSIHKPELLDFYLQKLWEDKKYRKKQGAICEKYVLDKQGATLTIMQYIEKILLQN